MKNESRHIQLNEQKWDEWAGTFDEKSRRTTFLHNAQNELITLLDLKENQLFLEIGCGTGWALGQIAERLNGKGQFYGVDLSSKMIEKASANFRDLENFHFYRANAESVPLKDNMFDIIFCTNSFHHYLHPEKALREMHRLLKTSGKVYILDPAADSLFIKLADQIIKRLEPEHVKMYSTKEFQNLFAAAGLRYVETKNISWHQKIQVGQKEA